MYKLSPKYSAIHEISSVIKISDNTIIPFAPDNTDYQVYLAWVAEGNTPEPADEVTE